jgi:acetyl/propionyl-CoA carboxylase alpha subunit
MIKITVPSGKEFNAEISDDNSVIIDGKSISPDMVESKNGLLHIIHNHKTYAAEIISFDKESRTIRLKINRKEITVNYQNKYDRLLHELGMDQVVTHKASDLKAPMPGLVVEIAVSEGDEVKKGDKILVLEAMKMENILKAAADATVKKVNVGTSNAVEKNQVLIEFD